MVPTKSIPCFPFLFKGNQNKKRGGGGMSAWFLTCNNRSLFKDPGMRWDLSTTCLRNNIKAYIMKKMERSETNHQHHIVIHVVIALHLEVVNDMHTHTNMDAFFSCLTSNCSWLRFSSPSIVLSALVRKWAPLTCPLSSQWRLLPPAPAWSSRRKDREFASQHKIDHPCRDGRGCVALGREQERHFWKEKKEVLNNIVYLDVLSLARITHTSTLQLRRWTLCHLIGHHGIALDSTLHFNLYYACHL